MTNCILWSVVRRCARLHCLPLGLIGVVLLLTQLPAAETSFYAARCARVSQNAWGIAERDGANRPTEPYLSSLVGGEAATGRVSSPPFKLDCDQVRFTIRGHDGQQGGRGENYVALIDNKTGAELRKTTAPGNDALQDRQWDVADLKGRTVRIEVNDGNTAGAFAWLGIGRIDAGPTMAIDFRVGLPETWETRQAAETDANRSVQPIDDGPVPFLAYADAFTWVPERGTNEVLIDATVQRLYLLGCTVPASQVMRTYGYVDVVYQDESTDTFPLVLGFTLESSYHLPAKREHAYVLPIGDATRGLIVIRPTEKPIAKLLLRRAEDGLPRPTITAVTCETEQPLAADQSSLTALQSTDIASEDADWIQQHELSTDAPVLKDIADAIRTERGVPVEADVDGNNRPDIVAPRKNGL